MIPIPQYPLYSATLTLNGGAQIGYYLDEQQGWSLKRPELELSIKEARKQNVTVRGLVVINPGNPTGQSLSVKDMEQIVDFCHKERIVLLADEVYQTNIYASTPFTSFKKVVRSMGSNYKDFELVSFHSVSKGFLGECGQRGGYFELVGFDDAVKNHVVKLASISLCANTTGQIFTGLMVNPPQRGDESHKIYVAERDGILSSLKRRAQMLAETLNTFPGIKCNPVEGSMYAFPRIELPDAFCQAAAKLSKQPDAYYSLRLLDSTGIVVVPGSGFGQKKGTYHFRTTILPSEGAFGDLLHRFKIFHTDLLQQYK